MARAFQPACVLTAAAELDVFSALHPRGATAQAVAARLGTNRRATAALRAAGFVRPRLLHEAGDMSSVVAAAKPLRKR
jgi:hypothetical protein